MIPIYRTDRMEWAANVLVEHFRLVLVRAAYDNYIRVRFRADALKDHRVFFAKVPSQIARWNEQGGALITWKNTNREGPHDAIMFAECPKSLEELRRSTWNTKTLAVLYEPPTWAPFIDKLEFRFRNRQPRKLERHKERLEIMMEYFYRLPVFTRERLAQLLARPESSQSSCAPASPAGGAHSVRRIP